MSAALQSKATGIPSISIIGAGISGLSLACYLQSLRIPFSLYEARSAESIGHNYGITLQRRSWRPLTVAIGRFSKNHRQFRQEIAVDRVVGGEGKVADQVPHKSATFQAVDRDLRQWLVKRLTEQNVQIKWGHKFTGIQKAQDMMGACLYFADQGKCTADIVIDTSGLRSSCFEHGFATSKSPQLLPYATYYGRRQISAAEFAEKFSHYFRTGNMIELVSDTENACLIIIQKIHFADQDKTDHHTVELRWIYSRPAGVEADPLYRPTRAPEEAKEIPAELYQEIIRSVERNFSPKKTSLLKKFFTFSDLHDDRILNWHLRVRLPEHKYFKSNSSRNGYQVIAIGDAAHGLPIVHSNGANLAIDDAKYLSGWLADVVSSRNGYNGDENFYNHETLYDRWFNETKSAIQRLRTVHGLDELSHNQLRDTIGFWHDAPDAQIELASDGISEDAFSDEEDDKAKLSGNL